MDFYTTYPVAQRIAKKANAQLKSLGAPARTYAYMNVDVSPNFGMTSVEKSVLRTCVQKSAR